MVTVCPSQFATRRTLFHVLVGCGLLMLKVSRLKHKQATTNQNVKKRPACSELRWAYCNHKRSEERFSRNAETDLVCRLLLEKKKHSTWFGSKAVMAASTPTTTLLPIPAAEESSRLYPPPN